jgi:hypothetical protein
MTPTVTLRNFKSLTKFTYVGLPLNMREQLTANRTYYVRTDGSNSNNGLANTSGGAFLTIQKAVDVVCQTLDISTYTVTIQVADGTYANGVVLYDWVGSGNVIILGNETTPANVNIAPSIGAITLNNVQSFWSLRGLKLSSSAASALNVSASNVRFQNLEFGACNGGGNHIILSPGSRVYIDGNYRITGGATNRHIANFGGMVNYTNTSTVTLVGSLTFSQFALVHRFGCIVAGATVTHSGGTITATRYDARHNSLIFTAGVATSTFFPGNVAGTVADGGGIYS